jgi:hypothetical protein
VSCLIDPVSLRLVAVPADVMKHVFHASTVIAVDIGAQVTLTGYEDYGETLYGLKVLWRKLNPWATPVKVPTMGEISSQLCYIRSVEQLAEAKERYIDFYLKYESPRRLGASRITLSSGLVCVHVCVCRPPVTHVSIMDFQRAAELQVSHDSFFPVGAVGAAVFTQQSLPCVQVIGYQYAQETVKKWKGTIRKERGPRARARMEVDPLELKRGVSLSALEDYHSA